MSEDAEVKPLASDIRAGVVWYVGCCKVTGEPCMVRQDRNYYDPKHWDAVPVVPKSALDAATARAEQAEAACVSKDDELKRLREAARKVVERASDCTLDDPLSVAIGQLESVLQAAQSPRAERSEP